MLKIIGYTCFIPFILLIPIIIITGIVYLANKSNNALKWCKWSCILCITSATISIGCSIADDELKPAIKSDDIVTGAEAQKGYKIIDIRMIQEGGTGVYDAEGIIQNTSGDIVDYCEVFVTFYDKDNNSLGTYYANTVNLMPNDTWKFYVYSTTNTKSAVRCEVTKVVGF